MPTHPPTQIPDARAAELHKAVAMAISNGVAMREAVSETLRLPLMMLQALRPDAFAQFGAFVTWQEMVCDMLLMLYSNAANQWQGGGGRGGASKQTRHLLARYVYKCVCIGGGMWVCGLGDVWVWVWVWVHGCVGCVCFGGR